MRQAAGGVDDQHVEVVAPGVVQRGQRDVARLLVAARSGTTPRRPAASTVCSCSMAAGR
jgi:hypothetical protein